MIVIKSPHEIELMREAGRITGLALEAVGKAVRPGVTTKELDDIAYQVITANHAKPTFLGYRKFPATLCVSLNEQLIHGVPGKRVLKDGDIVSVDCGANFEGYNGDSACTWPVGKVPEQTRHLIDVTRECFYRAAAQVRPGARLGEVSRAIQRHAESNGYSVVRQFTGHGVGRDLHESPDIPCFATPGRGPRLMPGMTLAIEPMVNMGGYEVDFLPDGFTVATCDGSLCSHYEHTVLVTETGCELLTARDGDESREWKSPVVPAEGDAI